jgi:hypothetical protein
VAHLDVWFFVPALAGSLLGGWHLCWAGHAHDSQRGQWARGMGIGALACLGITGLIAAGMRSSWLVPLGLLAGLLTVAMLWEKPESA